MRKNRQRSLPGQRLLRAAAITLLCVLCLLPAAAQPASPDTPAAEPPALETPALERSDSERATDNGMLDVLYEDVLTVGRDGLAYLLAPTRFGQDDWIRAGGIAGVTGGLMLFDERLQEIPRRNQSAGGLDAARVLDWGGHLKTAEIGTGLMYLTGWVSGCDELRVTGRMLAQSLIYSGTAWYAVAILAGRSRPSARTGAYRFDTGQTDNEHQSLPSGHTNVAFSVATVLAGRIDHWAASVVLYGAAAGVGLARLYQDHHWASDVFLGAMIGFTAGRFVVSREEQRTGEAEKDAAWSILPTLNGMALQVRL